MILYMSSLKVTVINSCSLKITVKHAHSNELNYLSNKVDVSIMVD